MATENYELSKDNRQTVLSTAVRFAGSDVGATFALTSVKLTIPANAIYLRGYLHVLSGDGGTAPTYSVGIEGSLSKYGANLDIDGTPAFVALTGVPGKITAAETVAVTDGTGTISGDGDFVLQIEYIVEGRSNEVQE
jgi:hypothetical protein